MQPDLQMQRIKELITNLANIEAELRQLTSDDLDAVIDPTKCRLILLQEAQDAIRLAESQFRHLAHRDALTGLPNRLLFMSRLEHAIEWARREGSRVGVLFVDLDRFKQINDALGHGAGDEFLKEVGLRMSSTIRSVDTVSRFGGDEFLVLLEGIFLPEDAALLAEKLIAAIESPVEIDGHAVETGVSVGISLYPDDAEDGLELIKAADLAMYRVKAQGGNSYRFSNETAMADLEPGSFRHPTIGKARSVLRFRPVVDVRTGGTVGVQCFARLGQQRGGAFSERLLRDAFRQVRTWQEAGVRSLRYAIALPEHQSLDTGFLHKVETALAESGAEPGAMELVLEVRESAIKEAAGELADRLERAGLKLLLIGFGTGYSSLSELQRLPLAGVIIDRNLVRGVVDKGGDRKLVRAVVALAHELDTRVIAGGVESREQLALLRELGCDEAQGPLFGELTTAGETLRLLQSRSAS